MNKDVLEEVIRVETLKKIRSIFEQTYYYSNVLSEDCTIDSLVRLDGNYKCKECVLADIVNTVRIMCPFIIKRETRILK